jgi:hypothetical protein
MMTLWENIIVLAAFGFLMTVLGMWSFSVQD